VIKTHLTETDIDRIIAATPRLRDKLIITMLYRTACRVSELVGIRRSGIDLNERLILIRHLKRRVKRECHSCGIRVGRKHNFCPSCGVKLNKQFSEGTLKQRLIPFDAETAKLIERYLAKRRDNDKRLIPLTRQAVYYIVANAAERAGLGGDIILNLDTGRSKKVSPHRFRDAFAIQAIAKDPSTEGRRHLQQHLGHEKFDTTAKYLKYAPSEASDWYDRITSKE